MDLHQIRYFLAVCEARNFTRAAERCHVTQPSLTRAIQNLEHELRGQLFNRGRTGTTLTLFGEAMRREFAQVQSHVCSARATAEGWAKGTKGILRVGVSSAAGPKGVTQFLGAFQACYEEVALMVSEGAADDLIPCLIRSDIDAAIVAYLRVPPTSFTTRELYHERLVALMPVGHGLAKLSSVPLAKLAGERVLIGIHSDLRRSLLPALRAERVDLNITCHCSRDEWLIGMAEAGVGIAIVPEGHSLPQSLTARPLAGPTQQQSICLSLGEDAFPNAALRNLSSFAEQYLQSRSDPVVTHLTV